MPITPRGPWREAPARKGRSLTTTFYSDAASVRTRTGVEFGDLGQDSEDALTQFLEDLLTQVTDLMDRTMHKSYLAATPIPPGLNGIAADAASDSVREMIATRQSAVVRIDDFALRVIQSRVLGPDIRERLKLYGAGGGVASIDIGTDLAPDLSSADEDTQVFLLDPTQQ